MSKIAQLFFSDTPSQASNRRFARLRQRVPGPERTIRWQSKWDWLTAIGLATSLAKDRFRFSSRERAQPRCKVRVARTRARGTGVSKRDRGNLIRKKELNSAPSPDGITARTAGSLQVRNPAFMECHDVASIGIEVDMKCQSCPRPKTRRRG